MSNERRIITLHAGHFGHEGGAAYRDLREENLTQEVRDGLECLLTADGQDVRLVPEGISNYSEQGRWAAAQKGNIFVAIHFDAGGGSGCSAIIDQPAAVLGKNLGKALCAELVEEFGYRNRGVDPWDPDGDGDIEHLGILAGGRNWAVTDAACLVEVAFVDGNYDLIKSPSFIGRACRALARGIYDYLQLSIPATWLKTTDPKPEPPPVDEELAAAQAYCKQARLVNSQHDPTTGVLWGEFLRVTYRHAQLLAGVAKPPTNS